nr:loricrin-like [Aegilops tauschii subsp. strangulata]
MYKRTSAAEVAQILKRVAEDKAARCAEMEKATKAGKGRGKLCRVRRSGHGSKGAAGGRGGGEAGERGSGSRRGGVACGRTASSRTGSRPAYPQACCSPGSGDLQPSAIRQEGEEDLRQDQQVRGGVTPIPPSSPGQGIFHQTVGGLGGGVQLPLWLEFLSDLAFPRALGVAAGTEASGKLRPSISEEGMGIPSSHGVQLDLHAHCGRGNGGGGGGCPCPPLPEEALAPWVAEGRRGLGFGREGCRRPRDEPPAQPSARERRFDPACRR